MTEKAERTDKAEGEPDRHCVLLWRSGAPSPLLGPTATGPTSSYAADCPLFARRVSTWRFSQSI
jgi:hypothetical protein